MIKLVDLNRQYKNIKKEIDTVIKNVIDKTAFIRGHYANLLEKNFAKFNNSKYCCGLSNGTDAIFLSLKSLNITKDDEVIIPDMTFIATAESVLRTGAKCVLADINKSDYTIDVSKIESKITKKTKAIIPVHLYGTPCDMNEIMKLAKKYKLYVIEDCAQAHGALYKNKKVGNIGHIGCFSFYPGKNLGAFGDAGAITTNNKKIFEKIKLLSNHGRKQKYSHISIGYNHRIDGLQAAIVNVKLKYLSDWNKKRLENAKLYNSLLDENKFVLPFIGNKIKTPVFHLYVIQNKLKTSRNKIIDILKKNKINAGIHYPIPLHLQPCIKENKNKFYSAKLSKKIISLPMFPELKKSEIKFICEVLNNLK